MGSYSIRNVGLVNQLDRMEKEAAFMKNRQRIGKRTLATKISKAGIMTLSNDAWYNEQVGPPQLQALQQEITFKADKQLNPYGVLLVEFYDINKNLITTPSDSGTPSIDYIYKFMPNLNDGKLKWEIGTIAPPTYKYYVRYVVSATDSGTIASSADLVFYN